MAFCTGIQRNFTPPTPPPPPPSVDVTLSFPEKTFGKVSILNGDGSFITTGTIVPEGERTQLFGRIRMNPVLKIKSDEDGAKYDQAAWISKYKDNVNYTSVYASDPEAAKAYAEKVQKAAVDAAAARNAPRTPVPRTPRPRPILAPVQKTVFGMRQPPLSASTTPMNITPLPFNLNLPPLPPTLCLPRLI
jgi:hypothetical protein